MSTINKYLVAIDLDGTLLRSDKTISDKSIKFLQDFEKQGNFVVISSGRAPRSILKYQELLHLKSPFIAYNGAYAHSLYDESFKLDFKIEYSFFHKFYNDQLNKSFSLMMCESLNNVYYDIENEKLLTFFNPEGMNIIKGDITETLHENVYSSIIKLKEPLNESRKILKEYFSNIKDYEIRFWSNSEFAEIYLKGVSKGHNLEKIVEICKVLPQNVLVFGDAENDLEMLQMFENSFLMCNGLKDLFGKTKYITQNDNDHDGVVNAIENFIKNNN